MRVKKRRSRQLSSLGRTRVNGKSIKQRGEIVAMYQRRKIEPNSRQKIVLMYQGQRGTVVSYLFLENRRKKYNKVQCKEDRQMIYIRRKESPKNPIVLMHQRGAVGSPRALVSRRRNNHQVCKKDRQIILYIRRNREPKYREILQF